MLCAGRFSAAVDRFIVLPNPTRDRQAYIDAIVELVQREGVDLFVPCSTGGATIEDCAAADRLRKLRSPCVLWAPTEEMARRCHYKDAFTELCDELGLETPAAHTITSVQQGVDFLTSSKVSSHSYILKSIAFGDDAGRSDMTLLPRPTPEATRQHLSRTSLPISDRAPHVLQRYVVGTEICTHASVWRGELRSFLCCPSSDLLMRYADIRTCGIKDGARMAELAERWTRDFLGRWANRLEDRAKLCAAVHSTQLIQAVPATSASTSSSSTTRTSST